MGDPGGDCPQAFRAATALNDTRIGPRQPAPDAKPIDLSASANLNFNNREIQLLSE